MTVTNTKPASPRLKKFFYFLLTGMLCALALYVLCRIALCNERQYDKTHSYCEECSRELEITNLISVNGGNGLVCAQCIDEYTKCVICDEYRHNDTLVDSSHCENCVDYSIVGYTSRETPIVEIDAESIPWTVPADSDCFSEIAFDDSEEILYVRFRDSNAAYRYLGFSLDDWKKFVTQESPGSWYNSHIKGLYECQKIEE